MSTVNLAGDEKDLTSSDKLLASTRTRGMDTTQPHHSDDTLSRDELECLVLFLASKAYPNMLDSSFQGNEKLGEDLLEFYRSTLMPTNDMITSARSHFDEIAR